VWHDHAVRGGSRLTQALGILISTMKRLTNVYDRNELAALRSRLRSRGVPTYVGFRRFTVDAFALFVCVDAQYEDALALIRDPHHVVARPVDPQLWEQAVGRASLVSVLKGALLALVVLVILAFAARALLGGHA